MHGCKDVCKEKSGEIEQGPSSVCGWWWSLDSLGEPLKLQDLFRVPHRGPLVCFSQNSIAFFDLSDELLVVILFQSKPMSLQS